MMARRVLGWMLIGTGSLVFVLGAFLTWSTWDATSWGFASFTSTAAMSAALGGVSLVAGLVLLQGRPRSIAVVVTMLGAAIVALAVDLFARDAGGSLFGELDGWQGSDADGLSSLAPVWALLLEGLLVAAAAAWCRRGFGRASEHREADASARG